MILLLLLGFLNFATAQESASLKSHIHLNDFKSADKVWVVYNEIEEKIQIEREGLLKFFGEIMESGKYFLINSNLPETKYISLAKISQIGLKSNFNEDLLDVFIKAPHYFLKKMMVDLSPSRVAKKKI